MVQLTSSGPMPRSRAMSGRATFTAEMSRMTMSCATHNRMRSERWRMRDSDLTRTVVSELVKQTALSGFSPHRAPGRPGDPQDHERDPEPDQRVRDREPRGHHRGG